MFVCFSGCSQTYSVHICLAMIFIVSHLVCCNIRRTVGSLWRSCVISRRVTHLEPSHRADKPLLCLGHLEGWSRSLRCTLHTSQSFPERKRHLTWSRIVHTLTYKLYPEVRAVKWHWSWRGSVAVLWKIWMGSKQYLKLFWSSCSDFRVLDDGVAQRSTICCSAEVLCKDQVIKGKSSISLFKWELLF